MVRLFGIRDEIKIRKYFEVRGGFYTEEIPAHE